MIELTPKERRELRAKAHRLRPVVIVGQHGLAPSVLHEIDLALKAHGLIKVRVFSEDRAEREVMLARIAGELDAAPVQHLGKLLIVWRPPEEVPPKKKARRVAKQPAKQPAKLPAKQPVQRAPRAMPPVGRRARGQPIAEQVAALPNQSRRLRASAGTGLREPRGKSAPNPRRRRRAA